jgi:hypothetical protein
MGRRRPLRRPVTADDKEKVEADLGDRKVKVAKRFRRRYRRRLASPGRRREPLIAPMAGKAESPNKASRHHADRTSVVRYEIPGFKQLQVKTATKSLPASA